MKISLLALASAAAAVPHYGAHSKFHSLKPSGAHGTGHGKPYPTGGWNGSYNSTRVPYPSGTGSYDNDKTIDVTTTSTTTIIKTVVVKPSPAPVSSDNKAVIENVTPAAGDKCGPATVTVTASEKVTVTVTPGGGADVPMSSVAPIESKGEEATTTSTVKTTTKVEETRTTKAPGQPSKAPEAPSSKVEEYQVSSIVQKPVASAVVSSAAPSKTPSSGTGGTYSGSKRGLAYNEASLCKSLGSKFGFGYNWGQVENNDIGAPFIPMMHGPTKATSAEWLANVDKAVKKGSKAVMGFNEPDHQQQANLSPAAACAAWKEYMNPIASSHPSVKILGPSVTNSGSPNMGLAWLSSFHEVCPDAIVHATNIHFYDIYEPATIERFKAHVEKAASLYNLPVWITEFGLNPGSATQEQAASFLKEAMAYLDASDKVQGYSWFMVGNGENQLNSGSGLSTVGQVYAAGY